MSRGKKRAKKTYPNALSAQKYQKKTESPCLPPTDHRSPPSPSPLKNLNPFPKKSLST